MKSITETLTNAGDEAISDTGPVVEYRDPERDLPPGTELILKLGEYPKLVFHQPPENGRF